MRARQVIALRDGAAIAAVWSHAPVQTEVCGLPQHALVLHLSGSTLVEKWRDGRLVGHRSRIGSVSLVPAVVHSGDFFAQEDEVAAVLIRLVLAQAREGTFDELAHDEVMAMLLRHFLVGIRSTGRWARHQSHSR